MQILGLQVLGLQVLGLQVLGLQHARRNRIWSGAGQGMTMAHAIWIKDPLAILADGAERGLVVEDGRIVELVGKGARPKTQAAI